MKNSIDTIGNRTRDLPACSAVPQPTALPRAPALNTQEGQSLQRQRLVYCILTLVNQKSFIFIYALSILLLNFIAK